MPVHLSYRRSVFIHKILELNFDAIGFIFEETCWILPHLQQPRSQWFLPNLICERRSFSTVCFPTTCMINWQPFIFDTIIYVDFEFQILLDSKTNCKIIGKGFSESKFNANDSNQNPSKIFPTILWSSHWLVDGIRFLFILPEAHSMSLCALSSNPKHVALLHLYRQQHIIVTAK